MKQSRKISPHERWLRALIQAMDARSTADLPCPRCQAAALVYAYIGDPATRRGFVCLWCNECKHGTHWSLAAIPPNEPVLPLGSPMADTIPELVWR